MNASPTALPGVILLEPKVWGDDRGSFFESYREDVFTALGIPDRFVQENHSTSRIGVVRGLHYQLGKPQAKLIRVIQGEIFDVAVDIRRGSPTFGKAVGETLSAANRRQIYIPVGFAHGFLVTSPVAEVLYKCTDFYAPKEERGIRWNDPALNILWPAPGQAPTINARDSGYPLLKDAKPEDLPVYRS